MTAANRYRSSQVIWPSISDVHSDGRESEGVTGNESYNECILIDSFSLEKMSPKICSAACWRLGTILVTRQGLFLSLSLSYVILVIFAN